jgi:hypothetical protein
MLLAGDRFKDCDLLGNIGNAGITYKEFGFGIIKYHY